MLKPAIRLRKKNRRCAMANIRLVKLLAIATAHGFAVLVEASPAGSKPVMDNINSIFKSRYAKTDNASRFLTL